MSVSTRSARRRDDDLVNAAVKQVLSGQRSYDDLLPGDQGIVRAVWQERVAARLAELDFAPELEAAGVPYSEADADGNVVVRYPR